MFKPIALLREMLDVTNTAYCADILLFLVDITPFPKGILSFERKVGHVEMHAALLQRAWCTF